MRQMIFLLILFCSITGCGENDEAQSDVQFVNFNEEFQIGIDEKAVIAGNESGELTDSVLIEAISMQDNRCPENVDCIRAGEVQLKIVASNKQQVDSIATCIGVDCGVIDEEFRNPEVTTEIDTTSFTLNGKSYKLLFKEANPYPKVEGNKKVERADKAILKVIR